MTMSIMQQIITIAMVASGTVITRFLSFIAFPPGRNTPKYIQYLGMVLPAAVLGLLVIYCFKDVNFLSGSHGVPELSAVAVVSLLHIWKRKMFLSMAGGTIVYMVLVQFIF